MQKKPWKSLKQKQKGRISDKIYKKVFAFYWQNQRMPDPEETVKICRECYHMTLNMAVDITYEEFEKLFNKKFSRYEERIQREIEQGMTLEKLNYKKPKKTPEEKKAIQKQKTQQRRNRRKKQEALKAQEVFNRDQDDNFFFIAGYTSGGAPYGVTWEQMGMEPWGDSEDEDEVF